MPLPTPDFYDLETGVTLFRADCYPLLLSFEGIDAVVTDPPYGQGYRSNHNDRKVRAENPWTRYLRSENFKPIEGDDGPFDPAPLFQVAPKVLLWGANYYFDRLPEQGRWLIWDKREGTRSNHQADCEMAWANQPGVPRLYSHLWIGLCRRGEENLAKGGRKLHPNQKPVAVMDWTLTLLEIEPGQIVLDPFMGSGSLGVACIRRGIRYIGIEKDPEYFAVARDRLSREITNRKAGIEPPKISARAIKKDAAKRKAFAEAHMIAGE